MLTRGKVCYNLKNTPYKISMVYEGQEVIFHFSSSLYIEKFASKRDENRNIISESLNKRFGYYINSKLIADIRLYSQIEKRGFLISVNGEYIECLKNIKLDGMRMIVRN